MIPVMKVNGMSEFGKALSPDEPQTIDGYSVTGLQKSIEKPMIFGICWKPDPRGYGIIGAMLWTPQGSPKHDSSEDATGLTLINIPDHIFV